MLDIVISSIRSGNSQPVGSPHHGVIKGKKAQLKTVGLSMYGGLGSIERWIETRMNARFLEFQS